MPYSKVGKQSRFSILAHGGADSAVQFLLLPGRRTDIQVYFCDPQSPWQRGTNENTNGLLRNGGKRSIDDAFNLPDFRIL